MRFFLPMNTVMRYTSALALCCLFGSVCVAQQPEQTVEQPSGEAVSDEIAAQEAAATSCDPHYAKGTLVDRLHSRLYRITCSSASWFDGLFSNKRYQEDYRATYGNLYAGSTWSQQGDFDKVLRFQARLYLPRMRNRLHAFVGRVDRDEFVTESANELRALPLAFNRNLDDSMLLGLGYSEPLKRRGSFDADIGTPTRWPPDPYVKGSYRYARPVGESNLIRFRETLFWQDSEGFGTTTRVDWDRVLTDDHLARWTASGTLSEITDGMSWYSTLTLYQVLGKERALAYEVAAGGHTDRAVPLTDYGFSTIYRQTIGRSWLWLELRAGVDWPREFPEQQRRSNLNAALAFELRYGGQQ